MREGGRSGLSMFLLFFVETETNDLLQDDVEICGQDHGRAPVHACKYISRIPRKMYIFLYMRRPSWLPKRECFIPS